MTPALWSSILARCERILAASTDPFCAAYFRGIRALGDA